MTSASVILDELFLFFTFFLKCSPQSAPLNGILKRHEEMRAGQKVKTLTRFNHFDGLKP